jgi:hypothetical protein
LKKGHDEHQEYLIQDYACAWKREILIQGRLYVSNLSLHFYANILGWIHSVSIPLARIKRIEKASVVGITTAIEIVMDDGQNYFFASFISSRDGVFDLIQEVKDRVPLDVIRMSVFARSEEAPPVHALGYTR